MVNSMNRAIVLDALPPRPDGVDAIDPNDAFLVAKALAAEADYLVTGDRPAGLLQRGSVGRTRIMALAIFYAEALCSHPGTNFDVTPKFYPVLSSL